MPLFVDLLLTLLFKLASDARRWTDLSFKNEVVSDLEDAAVCVQHGLWLKLRTGDDATDLGLRRLLERIADGIRARKMWVLTPKLDTRDRLLEYLADTLLYAARGDWDSLEKGRRLRVPRSRRFRQRLAHLLQSIVVATIPLAALFGLQRTPWALKGDGAAQAIAVALVWAVLSLVASVDPLSGTKLSVLKEFKGFPFGTLGGGR